MFKEQVVIDARGHLLGRLASTIAKELLNGQKIVVVRCEDINISGSLYRNRVKYSEFLRKRMNSNPQKGPFHHRAPSRMLYRCIRGMIPHKTHRGEAALDRLKVFDGVPEPYDTKKRVVVPHALKVIRLKTHRKFCRLGDLSTSVGWGHDALIKRMEDKRRVRSDANYQAKKKTELAKRKAAEATRGQLSAGDKTVHASVGL